LSAPKIGPKRASGSVLGAEGMCKEHSLSEGAEDLLSPLSSAGEIAPSGLTGVFAVNSSYDSA
jgi:hypothetical protein